MRFLSSGTISSRLRRGQQVEDDGADSIDGHHDHEAAAVVAVSEKRDQLENGEVDEKDPKFGAEHAKGSEGNSLVRIRGECGEDGCNGGVDAGVEDAADDVSDCGVDDLCGGTKIGCCEGEDPEEGEGHAEPEKPWAAFAPAAVGAVEDDAPDGGVDGVDATGEEQDGASGGGGDAVDIGVKLEEIKRDDTEDELSCDFAGGVAEATSKDGVLHARRSRRGGTLRLRLSGGDGATSAFDTHILLQLSDRLCWLGRVLLLVGNGP